jgi:hypothetical protein
LFKFYFLAVFFRRKIDIADCQPQKNFIPVFADPLYFEVFPPGMGIFEGRGIAKIIVQFSVVCRGDKVLEIFANRIE